jgi:hypothetical protein
VISFEVVVLISLFIVVTGFGIALSWDYLKEKKKKPVFPPAPINFEADIQFLNYIINHKIKQTRSFLLEPLKIAGQLIITDKEFNKYTNDIVSEVYETLSPNYKRTLLKYFDEQSLITFITEVVFRELTVTCIEMNFSNFFKRPVK